METGLKPTFAAMGAKGTGCGHAGVAPHALYKAN